MRKPSTIAYLLSAILSFSLEIQAKDIVITEYGAKPGAKVLCTQAIQKAIDYLTDNGGGRVIIPKGKFLSGAIVLKSDVTLHLEKGATLLGSKNPADYVLNKPRSDVYWSSQLILAGYANNIGVTGYGTIDGQGSVFTDENCNALGITRPMLLRIDNCKNITISGVKLRNAGVWMQLYYECENITIKDVNIYNHGNNCNDGLDINNCKNVTISGVTVDSDDDAICLKSSTLKTCENIKVTNCTVSSHCNALKIGTESLGGFKNISFTNCKVRTSKAKKVINGRANGISAISVESVDGAPLSNVFISDIDVKGTEVPIFVRVGNCGNTFTQKVSGIKRSSIKGVTIKNVDVRDAGSTGCSITGIPGQKVEDVHLSNITIRQKGGMPKIAAPKDDRADAYPEGTMWGTLPASGFFVKNAKNVTFDNVKVYTKKKDGRPYLYKVNVE